MRNKTILKTWFSEWNPEVAEILDTKYNDGKSTRYSFPLGTYEVSDINLLLKSLIPNDVKINTTTDDIRLGSNLTTNKTIWFTKKSFI